ncbi:MAG: NAD(P)/FAD-dependent oxidoreductase, partial [Planctomycetaceae bacterium]|nr:NAD(P)/FAD-dependent oxidoreductase [Planctomycetaceae bacterium]
TLIDRRNFHLFQPLLYQVATGGLSPANIASPLRHVLSRQKNCRVLLGDVLGFDLSRQMVQLEQAEVPFDTLIVAAGARHSYFGKDQWEPYAPGLKTIEDATAIRARVFSAFEAAERESDSAHRREWLNFVIVGGGPTGVELAGALAEIAHHSLKYDFRSIDPADAHILLVEAGPRVLAAFPPDLSEKAAASLARLQVEVRTGTLVTNVGPTRVSLKHGEETTVLATRTVLWAAGVQASPLARALAVSSGADLDRAGRITVLKDFSLPQHPEVFVIGDMAHYQHDTEHPLPGVAPAAIQAGKFVASLISARQYGKTLPTFAYRDKGSLATIGRSKAVAEIGRFRFGGFFAWVTWLFVHLMEIVTFRNRLLVLLQWAWSYFSYDRSARLITGRSGAESAPLSEPQHPTVPSDARPR